MGREIDLGAGLWTLWVVVGRPGKLPDAEELRPHLGRGGAARLSAAGCSSHVLHAATASSS
jgi:hypothetical protein